MSGWFTAAMVVGTIAVVLEYLVAPRSTPTRRRIRVSVSLLVVIGSAIWLLLDGAVPQAPQ